MNEQGKTGGDGLYILSPDKKLVHRANKTEDPNDASDVLRYKSGGMDIVIAGDSHDETWSYTLKNHRKDIKNVTVLIARHHGRYSFRDHEFLDIMEPSYTLFGCVPSKDLGYSEWNSRYLEFDTNNQCGNFTLEIHKGHIDIYIENAQFAQADRGDQTKVNHNGFYFLKRIQGK